MSGESWESFCDELKSAGKIILREDLPDDELTRAEGHRYLVQQLSAAIEQVLLGADLQPLLSLSFHKTKKWGGEPADGKFISARIHGDGRYRLHGTLGTARLTAMQLARTAPTYQAFGSLSNEEIGEPGEPFEVMISREQPADWGGPWLELDPTAHLLFIRQYFGDWEREVPSEMMLERLDPVPTPQPLTPEVADGQLAKIAATFAGRVPAWFEWVLPMRADLTNAVGPPVATAAGLDDNLYGHGWFDLEEDQALIITLDRPDALLWGFVLQNFWWESIDYVNHTSSLNGDQAVASSDGRFRLVIARRDPGVPNWLDTGGHREGVIQYRYQRTADAPVPEYELVSMGDLRTHLLEDTPEVSPEERQAELRIRRAHTARRWAP